MVRSVYHRSGSPNKNRDFDENEEQEESSDADPEDDNLSHLFTRENGQSVFFCMDGLVTKGQKRALQKTIIRHGGKVCEKTTDADVILCPYESLSDKRKKYWIYADIYVESLDFIQRCLRARKYAHAPVIRKGMGGPRPGLRLPRTEYVAEDDMNLCSYLSKSVPYKEAGGRQGEVLYMRLMDLADDEDDDIARDYAWAKRHTWQSWRERYKKNQARFDAMIDDILKENPPRADGRGQYELDRRMGRRGRGQVYIADMEESSGDDDRGNESEHEEEEIERALDEQVDAGRARADEQGRKRRRSDRTDEREYSGKVSHTKRPRVIEDNNQDMYRHNQVPEVEMGRRASKSNAVNDRLSKGKGRASSIHTNSGNLNIQEQQNDDVIQFNLDDFDMDMVHDPLPAANEAGPSGTQRTPPHDSPPQSENYSTPAAPIPPPRMRSRVPRQPFVKRNELASSQVTLVGPVPTQLQGNGAEGAAAGSKRGEELPNHSIEPTSARNDSQDVPVSKPQPKKRRKVVSKQGSPSYQFDGPSRNTRACSRSIEPSVPASRPVLNPLNAPASRRSRSNQTLVFTKEPKDLKGKQRAQLPAVSEVRDEEDVALKPRSSLGETQEEQEVENVVTALSHVGSLSSANSNSAFHNVDGGRSSYRFRHSGENDIVALPKRESDDQEIIDQLEPHRLSKNGELHNFTDEDFANNLNAFLSEDHSSRQASVASTLAPVRKVLVKANRTPRAESFASQDFDRSVSSGSSWETTESNTGSGTFPVTGTRARMVKVVDDFIAQNTPYRPPRGTKAQEVLRSRGLR